MRHKEAVTTPRLFTHLHDPDGNWVLSNGFWVQQAADAQGVIDLNEIGHDYAGLRIHKVRAAFSHPARTGSAPASTSNRFGWSLGWQDLSDTASATWTAPEVLDTVAPTIVGFERQDQSGSLAVYQSQHFVELSPSTPSERIDPKNRYFAVIKGETAAGFNGGEFARFFGLWISFARLGDW